jgi:ATP-dependent RNA circularization protein (DNA/RNA ligase family)
MQEYPKIETLFDRDEKTFKVVEGKWRCPEFEYLKDNKWLFTEKVDGTNVRIMWNGLALRFGGRSDNAQMPTFLLTKLQELFPPEKFTTFTDGVCLYGEGYGAKIQKGGGNYIANGVDFVLFDVKIGEWWLERPSIEEVALNFGIKTVPIIHTGAISEAVNMVGAGIKSTWGDFLMEGLVIRPLVTMFNRKGQRIIGKIKTRDF